MAAYLLHTVIKKGIRRVFLVCEGSVLNEGAEQLYEAY